MSDGPQVVAHRGASVEKPEHTLTAYLRAIELGADALECDVRLTADGHLVCVHDRRVDRTSDGRGVVSTLELAHLEGLDWASWMAGHPDDEAEVPDRDAARILTLRKLLDAVRDSDRSVQVAIETKHPTRYAGLVERRLAQVLAEYGWDAAHPDFPSPVRVMSFSPVALRRMRQFAPGLPLVLLVDFRVPLRVRDGTLPKGVGTLGPGIRLLRRHPELVERVHERGGAVHVWTVDEDADIDLCVRLGVDAIITNRPRHVLKRLGRPVPPRGIPREGDASPQTSG